MALLSQRRVQITGDHQHAEEQYAFVDEGRQAPPQAGCLEHFRRLLRRRGHCALRGLSLSRSGVRVAAPCAPRCGSNVALSTKPGVAATLGRPACWCKGGVAGFETRLVVAPEPRFTTVGPTGCAGGGAGARTTLDFTLASPLRDAREAG